MKERLKQIFISTTHYLKNRKSIIIKGVAGIFLLFFVFIIAIYFGIFGRLPSKKTLGEKQFHKASEIYSEDGVLLGRYFIHQQTDVQLSQIPRHVINALIATEDVRFYKHKGNDASSMLRVIFKTLILSNSSSGGGSTISQQLAKSWYPRKDYWVFETPINKLKEMIIAQRIESVMSKDQILEKYFNAVHMGGNHFGIAEGARVYFNKNVEDLSVAEGAVLVGMLKASTRYSPYRNPDLSKERRNVVLSQMAKYNYLPKQEAETLKNQALVIHKGIAKKENNESALYFKDFIKKEIEDWCEENENRGGEPYQLYHDGLKIYTTINSKAQQAAEKAVASNMSRLQNTFNSHWRNSDLWSQNKQIIDQSMKRSNRYLKLEKEGLSEVAILKNFSRSTQIILTNPYSGKSTRKSITPLDSIKYYLGFLQTGFLAMEPSTGKIRAWVGGINQKIFGYDHILSKRQVGSTFKPILYAAAINKGLKPCDLFANELRDYDGWEPHNADENYGGKLSMVQALAYSVNTVSAQLIDNVGVRSTKNMAEDLGITSDLPNVPSLALGTAEISLLEMTNAYATLANEGVKRKPYYISRITDHNDKELEKFEPTDGEEAVKPRVAQLIIQMMKAVVDYGTAKSLRSNYKFKMDIAGKTGTTQNQGDGWFIGIVPNLVAGVWVGGESANIRFRTTALGQGARTALPIWADFIKYYSADQASISLAIFKPLPASLNDELACIQEMAPIEPPTYTPEARPTEIRSILRSIFGGKGKKHKNKGRKGKH